MCTPAQVYVPGNRRNHFTGAHRFPGARSAASVRAPRNAEAPHSHQLFDGAAPGLGEDGRHAAGSRLRGAGRRQVGWIPAFECVATECVRLIVFVAGYVRDHR